MTAYTTRGVKKLVNRYSAARQNLSLRKDALDEQIAVLDEQRAKLQMEQEVLDEVVQQQAALQNEIAQLNHKQHADGLIDQQHSVPRVSSNSIGSKPSQYAAHLLRTAGPADIQRAKTFTPEDWCRYFASMVASLCCMLEVINRVPHQPVTTQTPQAPYTAPLASQSPAASLYPDVCVLRLEHNNPSSMPFPGFDPVANSQEDLSVRNAAAAQQALAGHIDDFMRLILLQQVLTEDLGPSQHLRFTSYRAAALIDLATGEQRSEAGFTEHWVQAARAFAATPNQIQKLQICYRQYLRCKHMLRERQLATCRQVEQDLHKQMQRLGLDVCDAGARFAVDGSSQKGDVAAASADPDSATQLQGVLSGIMVTNQMLLAYVLETFSRLQLARPVVLLVYDAAADVPCLGLSNRRYFQVAADLACYNNVRCDETGSLIEPLCNSMEQQITQAGLTKTPEKTTQKVSRAQEPPPYQPVSAAHQQCPLQLRKESSSPGPQQQQQPVLPLVRAFNSLALYERDQQQQQLLQQRLQHQQSSFWQQHPELLAAAEAAGLQGQTEVDF